MDRPIVIFIIIVVLILIYNMYYNKSNESFTSTALQSIGSLGDIDPVGGKNISGYDKVYEYGSQYNPFYPVKVPTDLNALQTPIREGFNDVNENNKTWVEHETINRLDRIDDKLLPKISTNLTPYNVDVADPVAYTFQVHAPRVIRKDPIAMLADPIRGDIPITYFPDIPIIQQSQYNRDSLRLDGLFSPAFKAQYDKLTGSEHQNYPQFNSYGDAVTM